MKNQLDYPPTEETTVASELQWLDGATQFLDNRFRIPGTDIRFGLDFLIGLMPGLGDVFSFGLSSLLVIIMARKGASGMVVVKMLRNIILDTLVGTIPILGDIFDLSYRANRRNMHLLQEHYQEGEHQGSAWPVIFGLVIVLIGSFVLVLYGVWQVLSWSMDLLFNSI